jgi:dolichol-phosphate mannosyltransferase
MDYNRGVSLPAAPQLTIVVPTYNERDRIEQLVEAVFAAAAAHDLSLAMVIVDDNSPDGTGAVADTLATRYPLRVIHRAGKLGLGTAVMDGFHVATTPVVGVMDADFSHPPALVPELYQAFQSVNADVAVASRYIPGGSTPNWPWKRRLLSRTACLLARGLSPIRDAASGFFLIRREIAADTTIKAGGFKICLELIVRGGARRLIEVPYRFDDRELGDSKMSTREALGFLIQLRDLYWLRLTSGRQAPKEYSRRAVRAEGRGDTASVKPTSA